VKGEHELSKTSCCCWQWQQVFVCIKLHSITKSKTRSVAKSVCMCGCGRVAESKPVNETLNINAGLPGFLHDIVHACTMSCNIALQPPTQPHRIEL